MQRASYQRLNPNMSIHKIAPKPKQACLAFKSGDGVMFSPLNKGSLRTLATYVPNKSTTEILIALINGEALSMPLVNRSVTLVYK